MSDDFKVKITGGTVGQNARGATAVFSTKEWDDQKVLGDDVVISSSLSVEGNINIKNDRQRKLYDKWIRGAAAASDFLHPVTLENEIDPTEYETEQYLFPPTWTHLETGRFDAFISSELSSSQHEVSFLNAFHSGSEPLEQTAVPASASLFYQKNERFVHAVYKLSASAATVDLTKGTEYFDSTSGSQFVIGIGDSLFGQPAAAEHITASFRAFEIEVPDYGRIHDIKVWVEIVRKNKQSLGLFQDPLNLGELFLGLRSPNVKFLSGIPIVNDQVLRKRAFTEKQEVDGSGGVTGSLKNIHKNTYILWDGMGTDPKIVDATWTDDFSIRTVFSDASKNLNPRHMNHLFRNGTNSHDHNLRGIGSPTWKWEGEPVGGTDPNGAGLPWYSEAAILSQSSPAAANGSPPAGWLSGPGGTNADHEWPTTGSNYGPENILPVYPLLDDIKERRPALTSSLSFYEGFRPGLRGTEIHGTWQLIVGQTTDSVDTARNGYPGFFRQWRLEILYEKNVDTNFNKERFRKDNVSYSKKSGRLFSRLSGSRTIFHTIPDFNKDLINEVFESNVQNEYGTTVGITDSTASVDFAVFSRITGTLADRLSGTQEQYYLKNEFGTPFIPISSGSGEDPTFDLFTDVEITKLAVDNILNPKPLVSTALTLRSVLSNFPTTETTRDAAAELSSSSG